MWAVRTTVRRRYQIASFEEKIGGVANLEFKAGRILMIRITVTTPKKQHANNTHNCSQHMWITPGTGLCTVLCVETPTNAGLNMFVPRVFERHSHRQTLRISTTGLDEESSIRSVELFVVIA
jgi:hypothetical protein